MPSARQRALSAIKIGDVIYGLSGAGNDKLLLVYDADDSSITARHITSQTWAKFHRADGNAESVPSGGSCRIISAAALPADQLATAIGLDRKFRTGRPIRTLCSARPRSISFALAAISFAHTSCQTSRPSRLQSER